MSPVSFGEVTVHVSCSSSLFCTVYRISTKRFSSTIGIQSCKKCPNRVANKHLRAQRFRMDPKLQRIIEKMQRYKKPDDIWHRGEPIDQPVFTFEHGKWHEIDPKKESRTTRIEQFSVLSWNIDFMRSFENERMQRALDHVHEYVADMPNPVFVMFNEMLISDLQLIQAQKWVQDQYILSDINDRNWESGYYGECNERAETEQHSVINSVQHLLTMYRNLCSHTSISCCLECVPSALCSYSHGKRWSLR